MWDAWLYVRTRTRGTTAGGTNTHTHKHTPHAPAAGVAGEGSSRLREFVYYPRLTAMSTMYPDEADAAQVRPTQQLLGSCRSPAKERAAAYQLIRTD